MKLKWIDNLKNVSSATQLGGINVTVLEALGTYYLYAKPWYDEVPLNAKSLRSAKQETEKTLLMKIENLRRVLLGDKG